MEKPASQLERGASRQSRRRRLPCKHCAASALRRGSAGSWLGVRQLLEARIVAHSVPCRVQTQGGCSRPVRLCERIPKERQRFLYIAKHCVSTRGIVL